MAVDHSIEKEDYYKRVVIIALKFKRNKINFPKVQGDILIPSIILGFKIDSVD